MLIAPIREGDRTAHASKGREMPKRGWVPWERIPPVYKQFKKAGCEWHPGIGWVWNPTHREVK